MTPSTVRDKTRYRAYFFVFLLQVALGSAIGLARAH